MEILSVLLLWFGLCPIITATRETLLPDQSTIVYEGQARFTVLSPQLIRLEWSPTLDFVDEKTWVVQSRVIQPIPPVFNVTRNDTHLRIDTMYVTIEYLRNATTTFSQHNLHATVRVNISSGEMVTWNVIPGEEEDGNLLGTIRTLDNDFDSLIQMHCRNQTRADLHCTYGVISRRGYAIVDDTHRPQLDNDTLWPWIIPRKYSPPDSNLCIVVPIAERRTCGLDNVTQPECELRGCCFLAYSCFYSSEAQQDLYLFGHGRSYTQALFEFTRLAGPVPLPPRYSFGVFFSRFWSYAEYEERQIVSEYLQHDVPLDVLITDLDWHLTFYKLVANGTRDQAGQTIGWTGYTFDPYLFPRPSQFLAWCKQFRLRNSLSVHPASGIQPWEETYVAMARAMGIDPATQHYVPFNATDKQFNTVWFDIVLDPLEQAGVDLWWLDWQQGEEERWVNDIPYANPTFWLNHVFFTHTSSTGKRPMILHRWGGLGNHRYQVGFSGDVMPSWDTLTLQPRFTATAANVAFGFWSHDLGGHLAQPDPQLYVRWIQWGTFSPMFRPHSTKNANVDRRLWTFPWIYQNNLARFFRLRQALVPYLYTAARQTYDTGLSIVLPLYYRYPEFNESYSNLNEYFFGESMLVAPIHSELRNVTGMVDEWPIWFPPDSVWVNFFTGQPLPNTSFTLDEMPVYVRAGSIIPLLPEPRSNRERIGRAQQVPEVLALHAFIGGSTTGQGYVYDDDGSTTAYQDSTASASVITRFNYTATNNTIELFISAAMGGSFPSFPTARAYEIRLRGVFPASSVLVNNIPIAMEPFNEWIIDQDNNTNGYTYDGSTLTVIIYIRQRVSTSQPVQLVIQLMEGITHPLLMESSASFVSLIARLQTAKATLDNQWHWGNDSVQRDDYPFLLNAAATGLRITHTPSTASNELQDFFSQQLPGACNEIAHTIDNLAPNLRSVLYAQLQC